MTANDNGNGNYVNRAELAAHIKSIDQRFEDVAADIAEIKWSVIQILEHRRQNRLAWWPPLVAALVSAGIALPAVFFH